MSEPSVMDYLQEIETLKSEIQTNISRVVKNLQIMEQLHSKIIALKDKEILRLTPDFMINGTATTNNPTYTIGTASPTETPPSKKKK